MPQILKQSRIENCPCCGTSAIESKQCSRSFYVDVLENQVTYDFGTCATCGFIYVLNPLSEENLKFYYENAAYLRRQSIDEVEEEVLKNQRAFLERRGQKTGKVLEIGCDAGQFLNELSAHSWETYYHEYSLEANEFLSQKHRPYRDGDKESFDLIVMRHVFEHIASPNEFLIKLRPSLRADSKIFIEVPDWTYLDKFTDSLAFEHVNYFSMASLSLLLDRAGLSVVDMEFGISPGYHTTSNRVIRVLAELIPGRDVNTRIEAFQHHDDRVSNAFYKRIRSLVASEKAKNRSISFYAASWTSADLLLNANLPKESLLGIFDQDERKQKKLFHGCKVYSPTRLQELKPDTIIINSSYDHEISKNLRDQGFSGLIISSSDLLRELESGATA